VLKINLRCTCGRQTRLNAARRQTARSEQNYRHVTELICSQKGNRKSSRNQREIINLTAISLSSCCCEKLSWTQTCLLAYFSHCVKMILACFDYIVIFVYKILTHLSGFDFILCRKKRRLKCCIIYTGKDVHVQYKQHNLRGHFFMAHAVYRL